MKTVVEQKPLFETLSAEESANVNGACHYSNYCANPCWSSGSWGGGGWGGGGWGGGGSSSSAVTQTTNVNVLIND